MQSQNRSILIASVLILVAIIVTLLLQPSSKQQSSSIEIVGDVSMVDTANNRLSIRPSKNRYTKKQTYPRQHDTLPQINYTPYKSKPFYVEINSADTTDFKQLRGIGSTYAKRIVAYRNLLGGYVNPQQLLEVYGITDSLYLQIAPFLRINTDSINRIAIDEVSLDQLKRHPYVDYYQAKAIIKYRDNGNSINSSEDLLNIAVLDKQTIERIEPYLIF